jgi:hypothetical protein
MSRVKQPVHTSDLLKRLIDEAPKDKVDLEWLLGHLQKRAFGLLLLILAIAILVPGLGIAASVAIAFPAVEMMLGRDRPTLPRLLTKRSFATKRFTKWSMRALHLPSGRHRVRHSYPVSRGFRILGLDLGRRDRSPARKPVPSARAMSQNCCRLNPPSSKNRSLESGTHALQSGCIVTA